MAPFARGCPDMSPSALLGWALGALVASAAGTGLVLRAARARGVLDVPNHRSSHTTPTPRGGGVAIVGVVLAAELALVAVGLLAPWRFYALALGGSAVAAVGAWDDLHNASARARLAVHLTAGAIALAALAHGTAWHGTLLGVPVPAWAVWVVALLWIVWLTNLYNFMDGIDGIAGMQGVVVGIAAAAALTGAAPGLALVGAVLGGAAAGFLVFNWAPASIFMGDVGSGFLGATFAILIIAAFATGTRGAIVPLAALAPFIIDATITLALRTARGEQVTAAHRSHLYQRLVQRGWSHRAVTVVYGIAGVVAALAAAALLKY